MGNFTPTALLGLLAIVAAVPYAVWSRSPSRAVLFVAFGAALFAPEGAFLKFPLMPPLDKVTIPYVVLSIAAFIKWRGRIKASGTFGGLDWLIVLLMIGEVGTALTNTDPLRYGSWRVTNIQGMNLKDGFANAIWQLWHIGLPYLLGRWLFRQKHDLDGLYRFLVVAGLVQSLFLLPELRLSPFWHEMVYGYGAHQDFLQVLRWGGFRPINFMAHGLALSLFMCVALISSAVMKRSGESLPGRFKANRVFYYLLVMLVLCKSTGAIVYAIVFAPLVLRAKAQTLVRVAFVLACLTATYPVLRATQLLPTDALVDAARYISDERAESLAFRFDNEELLLAKARDRILFGWGTYGRNAVFDAEMGKEMTTVDGYWIILVSASGAFGFVGCFGLLLAPILMLRRRLRFFESPEAKLKIAGFAILLTVTSIDLLPNGNFSGYVYLLAGAMMGFQQEAMKPRSSWRLARNP